MPESTLHDHLAAERSVAIRVLLAHPLIDSLDDAETFRLVARHTEWLVEYFETACGWVLTVDVAAGYARLAKRPATGPDPTRPLRRTRGQGAPFDRRRYQLLCLICAELVRHPVTTVGLLASAVTGLAGLETGRRTERSAFVDSLLALRSWGALRATGGEVEAFLDDERANAILSADTARLHRLIACATAPSMLPPPLDAGEAADRLLAEPRYGRAGDAEPDTVTDEARHRWARHRLARRLLDDPVAYLDDLGPDEIDYLSSLSGRRWLRERVADAGLELEERAEGLLAVDTEGVATDQRFPAPLGNAHQLALLLADHLVETTPTGGRHLRRLDADQVAVEVTRIFDRFPGWARGARDDGGPARLAAEAIDLLVSFGLVRCDPDGAVVARPALARYRTTEPVVRAAPALWE